MALKYIFTFFLIGLALIIFFFGAVKGDCNVERQILIRFGQSKPILSLRILGSFHVLILCQYFSLLNVDHSMEYLTLTVRLVCMKIV